MNGYVYEGQHSRYRRDATAPPRRGGPAAGSSPFTQNHDQVANALHGARSSHVLTLEQQRLAAAVLFFSPFLPLLFMGQEYGETAEFLYFTEHGDPALIEAVREGRRGEISEFAEGREFVDPQGHRRLPTFQAELGPSRAASTLRPACLVRRLDRDSQASRGTAKRS